MLIPFNELKIYCKFISGNSSRAGDLAWVRKRHCEMDGDHLRVWIPYTKADPLGTDPQEVLLPPGLALESLLLRLDTLTDPDSLVFLTSSTLRTQMGPTHQRRRAALDQRAKKAGHLEAARALGGHKEVSTTRLHYARAPLTQLLSALEPTHASVCPGTRSGNPHWPQ